MACPLLALVAGSASWVGTKLATAPLDVGAALAGALNGLPVALLCLGAAIFALGWMPRAVLPIGVVPAVGGYLVQVLADSIGWPWWVAKLSPFAHVAMVPAAPPSWPGAVGLVIVAATLGLAGAVGYAKRDLLA